MLLEKIFTRDDSHEFMPILAEIEEEPVSPLGRVTFWIIIAVIFFTILWLIFGKVDIVVSARGIIIPDENIKTLQPLDTGVVSKILTKEGDYVKKGQVLMEIDPSDTAPELLSTKKNLEYLELESARLRAASNGRSFVTRTAADPESIATQQEVYFSSLDSLRKQVSAKMIELGRIDQQIQSARTEMSHYKNLLNSAMEKESRLSPVLDIIPKDDYVKVSDEISEYRSKVQGADYKLEELRQQQNQIQEEIEYIKASFRTDNLKELSERQKQITELKSKIDQITFRKAQQNIVAPLDGYVNNLMVHTVGGVVTPAEKLMTIVPEKAPLVVKASVLNKDIGYISKDMPVSLKIDTFDFQKYGLLNGRVKNIAKDSVEDEKLGPIYQVYITPFNKELLVDGKKESISSGMSLTAEIKVGQRRIIEFFIYPIIKYFNEGISVR